MAYIPSRCPQCGNTLGNGSNAAFNSTRPLMTCSNCGYEPARSSVRSPADRRGGEGADYLPENETPPSDGDTATS